MTEDNFKSLLPKWNFADTLAEQQEQLRDNPLLKRMMASRKAKSGDPHRPIYHYVNPENTLNDPNGLCFWQGRWHLFYQGYPPEDPRVHWGHAVSDDLIHWQDLPYAIYPDPEECCFSGAAYVEDDRVIAMYHGTQVGNMVAVSSDPLLLNWEKVTGQAVIPKPQGDGPQEYTVFDPCIWKKGDYYYSLSAGMLPDGPAGKRVAADFLFRSKDLASWEYLHPFTEGDRFTLIGDDGACPYFWPIGDRHILPFFSHMSGGQYLLGDYDTARDKFVVTSHGLFNFGAALPAGVHAPSATPDGDGGLIIIFNMNPGYPTESWNQIMSLPRRLTLGPGGDELCIEPAGDIESLRREHVQIAETVLPANEEVVLDDVAGNAIELNLEIDAKESPMVELNVLRSPNREEYTRIAFLKDRGFRLHRDLSKRGAVLASGSPSVPRFGTPRPVPTMQSMLTLDTGYSSSLPGALSRPPETAPIVLEDDEPLQLRVFVDRSIVEVFANGRQCVAARVYPGHDDSVGVSLRAQGSEAVLRRLDAWQMSDIYK